MVKARFVKTVGQLKKERCPYKIPPPFECPECLDEERLNNFCCEFCIKKEGCKYICERLGEVE